MSKSNKKWARVTEQDLGAAFGIEATTEPQAKKHFAVAATGSATQAEIDAAIAAAYTAKGWNALPAKGTDQALADALGVCLRTDAKGRKLALQSEDVPKGANMGTVVTVPDRDGNPVERRLVGTLRHNRSLGLAVAAGKAITANRRNDPTVREQVKLLRMEMVNLRATPEQSKEALSAFFAPHTVRVDLSVAKAYLAQQEPAPVSARKALRAVLGSDAVGAVDAALARIRAEKAGK